MLASVTRHRATWRAAVLKTALLIGLCFALSCIVWLVDRHVLGVALTAYIFSYGFWANALPVVLLFLLLLVISNRIVLATLMTVLLIVATYFADYQKLKFLAAPLSFNDFFLLRDVDASTIHLLANYVKSGYLLMAFLALLVAVGASIRYEHAFFNKRSSARWLLGAAAGFLSVTLVVGSGLAWRLYNPARIRVVPWSPMRTILHAGLLGSIEYANLDFYRALDVPVDRDAIKTFLGMMPSSAEANDTSIPISSTHGQPPDIVIIQSESFFDPAILSDVDNTQALLPNLHRALKLDIGGTMKAPTFGGGTLRTEFEVLTGIPMDAYPKIDFPYLQISQKHMPSLVGVLHDDGYKAYAVHGNSGGFWSRAKAFKEMGFDRFLTKKDFPANAKKDGWFLSDEAMTDQIIGLLAKSSSSPTMIFAVSIEGHGPYDNVPVSDMARRDALPAPAGWPAAVVNEYKNYLYHISNADRQLGRLWAYLESRHRPYVLAFYGDHLPGLQRVYAVHGFDNKSDGPSEFVPWFVLSSDRTVPQSKHIHAWMLGGEVLDAAGLARPPYYRMMGSAEQLLSDRIDDAKKDKVDNGFYSMSRLYLNGRFDREMPAIEAQEMSR